MSVEHLGLYAKSDRLTAFMSLGHTLIACKFLTSQFSLAVLYWSTTKINFTILYCLYWVELL